MEAPHELLTEQEAAVYDRQIRIWGVDAQRKLSKARVLVVGVTGVIAEVMLGCSDYDNACKNIVLAGIGSLTLIDDSPMTLEASVANFLVPFDELEGQGNSIAEVCAASLRDYNPMVRVSAEPGSISTKPDSFYDNFDAVIMGRSLISLRRHLRSLFVDLKFHSYTSKKAAEDTAVQRDLTYPSLEEALNVRWDSFPKRTAKLLFAVSCIEDFEQAEGRRAAQISSQDLPAIMAFWKKTCDSQKVADTLVPESLFQRLASTGGTELSPVCAIMGGIVGQELIKAMSSKGEPLKNLFFFDAVEGKGVIESAAPS